MEGSQSILLFAAASRQFWDALDCRPQVDLENAEILHGGLRSQLLSTRILLRKWSSALTEDRHSRDRITLTLKGYLLVHSASNVLTFNTFGSGGPCLALRSPDLVTDILLAFAHANFAYVRLALKILLLRESLPGPHVFIIMLLLIK